MVTWLQTITEFWLGGGMISPQILNICGISDVRQTEVQTAEPLMLEFSAFEFEMAIE
jgi:hypothetical protein